MEKLRANIGLTTPEVAEYKRELESKWGEFFTTQFDRFIGEPLRAVVRVGESLKSPGAGGYEGISETDQLIGGLFRHVEGGKGVSPQDIAQSVFEGLLAGVPGGTTATSAVGQIRGLPPKAARAVRKVMQKEVRARGKSPLGASSEGGEALSGTLRGTMYHGRRTLPEGRIVKQGATGETRLGAVVGSGGGDEVTDLVFRRPDLRGAREKDLNIGEPTGVSLTTNPVVASKFSKRIDDEFARVMPLYGQAPEDVMISAWTEFGGKVMKDAYMVAAKKLQIGINKGEIRGTYTSAKETLANYVRSNVAFTEFLKKGELGTKFNTLLTEELQSKGYKGIVYAPNRFDESEVKLFNPQDALVVDKRRLAGKKGLEKVEDQLEKQYETGLINKYEYEANKQSLKLSDKGIGEPFARMGFKAGTYGGEIEGGTKTMRDLFDLTIDSRRTSLRDWYKELDVAKELGLRKGGKGVTDKVVNKDYESLAEYDVSDEAAQAAFSESAKKKKPLSGVDPEITTWYKEQLKIWDEISESSPDGAEDAYLYFMETFGASEGATIVKNMFAFTKGKGK